jgi:hypothetical protein
MAQVKICFHEDVPWIVYRRLEIHPSKKGKKKQWSKFYWHCTCQEHGRHGAVDVRYDCREAWFGHECFPNEKSSILLQFEKRANRIQQELVMGDTFDSHSSLPIQSDCLLQSWFKFQAIHDISFRAAVSKEFYSLAHQLIRLGQLHPSASVNSMVPVISRQRYGIKLTSFAKETAKQHLHVYSGHLVTVILDSSKLFEHHYLLVY